MKKLPVICNTARTPPNHLWVVERLPYSFTLGITPVDRAAASGFGIMHSDANRRIYRFEEKPKDPKLVEELRIPPDLLKDMGRPADAELYQGSMGGSVATLELRRSWAIASAKLDRHRAEQTKNEAME